MNESTLRPPQVQVGRTSLKVSRIGLGTGPISGLYTPVPEGQAIATIHEALRCGVTFFDTAPMYGAGLSEQRLGYALRGVPRDQFVLATKVGRLVEADGSVRFDWSRDGILRSIEASLTRLGTDRIDIVHVHDPDHHKQAAFDVALPLLGDLRREGVIGAVGAGMNQWEMPAEFVRADLLDCLLLAGRYTLIEQHGLPLLELCEERRVAVFLGGVYNSGILATGAREGAKYNYADASAEVLALVQRMEDVCGRHNAPLRAAAVQFPLGHPAVTSLVIGARSPAEVREGVASLQPPLPLGLWEELRAAGLIDPAAPVPG